MLAILGFHNAHQMPTSILREKLLKVIFGKACKRGFPPTPSPRTKFGCINPGDVNRASLVDNRITVQHLLKWHGRRDIIERIVAASDMACPEYDQSNQYRGESFDNWLC